MMQTDQDQGTPLTVVILHYNTLDHTMACVESLAAQREVTPRVVVVDNGSNNGSGEELAKRFAGNNAVTLIRQAENIGYARGINLGYRHAKHVLKSTCICLSNNDVVYEDEYLARKVCEIFAREDCDVLGPAIYVPERDIYQNPQLERLPTLAEVDGLIWRYRRRRLRLRLGFGGPIGRTNRPANAAAETGAPTVKCPKPPSRKNAQLHGACLFVGPRFIADREVGFNPCTHFCCEEDILYLECLKAGYAIYYCSDIEVIHNAHATLRVNDRGRRKADIAFLKHQIAATRLFRKMLRKELAAGSGRVRKSDILFPEASQPV